MEKELTQSSITFGKYKDKTLSDVLKDRSYCKWLIEQPWFQINYEFLYNKVKEYDPKIYFIKNIVEDDNFLLTYKYFDLIPINELLISLTEDERKCYEFYLKMIEQLKNKILKNKDDFKENIYDIKAPVNWLKLFETDYSLKREVFKEFINTYELPNITSIVEDIKKKGNIEYKGAKSFNIAKQNSLKQEKYWEEILKSKYGEDISQQYKYEDCFFDFLNIKSNTIYECKLGLKDFNPDQYRKYLIALKEYNIIYIIGYDCIIDTKHHKIYTSEHDKYTSYIENIPLMKQPSQFDNIIKDFEIIILKNINDLL
jgi:hypothetical protein